MSQYEYIPLEDMPVARLRDILMYECDYTTYYDCKGSRAFIHTQDGDEIKVPRSELRQWYINKISKIRRLNEFQ